METIFMYTENSQKSELHKFALKLSQKLDLKNLDKHVALQNLSIYYTWKNIRQMYKNNKPKIIAPTWNDEFELLSGFYSALDIHIEFIIKIHETLTDNLPIHIYINRINNRLFCKIKDEYKLNLQTPETIKLFGSTKKLIDKTKNEENVPRLEEVQVVLVQHYLVDNINKSLRYYILLQPINLMAIC